jgi:hypothetical protein
MQHGFEVVPYTQLRALDRVVFGGTGFVAWRIRRRTAGFKKQFDKTVGTHTGLLVELHGQLFIAEMLVNGGLSIDTLERYIGNRKRFIVCFRRSRVFDDPEAVDLAQRTIMYMYRERLNVAKYDPRGIVAFINKHTEQNPNRWYCSEFDCALTAMCGCSYPASFEVKRDPNPKNPIGFQVGRVPPVALQTCAASWQTLHFTE